MGFPFFSPFCTTARPKQQLIKKMNCPEQIFAMEPISIIFVEFDFEI